MRWGESKVPRLEQRAIFGSGCHESWKLEGDRSVTPVAAVSQVLPSTHAPYRQVIKGTVAYLLGPAKSQFKKRERDQKGWITFVECLPAPSGWYSRFGAVAPVEAVEAEGPTLQGAMAAETEVEPAPVRPDFSIMIAVMNSMRYPSSAAFPGKNSIIIYINIKKGLIVFANQVTQYALSFKSKMISSLLINLFRR